MKRKKIIITQINEDNNIITDNKYKTILFLLTKTNINNKIIKIKTIKVNNFNRLLRNIVKYCDEYKNFIIHEDFLKDNFEDSIAFLSGFATALDVEIEILQEKTRLYTDI